MNELCLVIADGADRDRWLPQAEPLAQRLQSPLVAEDDIGEFPYLLWFDDEGVSLRQQGAKVKPIRVDWVAGKARHRRLHGGGRGQLIAKAVGCKPKLFPSVWDLTAGLGGDAFVLAGLGVTVTLVERSPLVFALLQDGYRRALECAEREADIELLQALQRMTLVHADAADWLRRSHDNVADVIHLDPMFPTRRKQAAVNKEMTAFHQLVGADDDANELLPLALASGCARVVVKRPRLAPLLAGQEPNHQVSGKSCRYDLYTLRKLAE